MKQQKIIQLMTIKLDNKLLILNLLKILSIHRVKNNKNKILMTKH